MKQLTDYKALYRQAQQQLAQRDAVIFLLQEQQMRMTEERQVHLRLIAEQDQHLAESRRQASDLQQVNAWQRETIVQLEMKQGQYQELIARQDTLIRDQQQQLDRQQKESLRLTRLQYQLTMLKRQLYGIRSEKRHLPAEGSNQDVGQQLLLNLEAENWGTCRIAGRRRIAEHLRVIHTVEPKKTGRHDLPAGLREEVILMDVPERPAGAKCIRYEEQRQLACDPERWYIKVIRRPVYLVESEDRLYHRQLIAPLPAHPIERCKLDVSVLALLFDDKYQYHLPVWRQQQRLRQYGISLPYSTLCWSLNRVCETLLPLWHLQLKEILVSGLMNMDETRYRVLDNSKKAGKKSHIGWMWALMNPVQKIVCFTYQKGRGKKDVDHLLKGYKGHLLTDAYGTYTGYGRQQGVNHSHCLSHARRYFVYALDNDGVRASYVLDHFFGPLYDIEQECKDQQLDYDGITDKRQAESLPLLRAMRQWLEAELPRVVARTPIHQAIAYTLNHYEKLIKYTADGILPVDNNVLEGQIRSIALSRNNVLFAGSHRGAELAAVAHSFVATCKLHQINVIHWLQDVLCRIKDCPDDKRIELLPQFWKPSTAAGRRSA